MPGPHGADPFNQAEKAKAAGFQAAQDDKTYDFAGDDANPAGQVRIVGGHPAAGEVEVEAVGGGARFRTRRDLLTGTDGSATPA